MLRRNFIKISGTGLLALPFMKLSSFGSKSPGYRNSSLWIHGSPYLGHADYRKNFRGLSADEIQKELVHFRTADPWRRAILFKL